MALTTIPVELVTLDDGVTITVNDNSAALTLKSTDTDASIGPILDLSRDNSSAADGDVTGTIRFVSDDDANNQTTYVQLVSKIVDASNSTEDGSFHIESVVAGSTQQRMDVLAEETVFNEGSQDLDFRVESDNSANALFVQGSDGRVGIGTSGPAYGLLDIRQTGTGAQDRGLYLEVSPSSSGSNNNAALISVGNGNMTNTVMRIHHETPAANQKLLSLDTTGSNTEKFWVDEDGDAYLAGSLAFASGAGIDFSATSNSADVTSSELFDDYEEGTWTPGISTTGNSFASGAAVGRYIKIGKQVIATMLINNNSSNTFGSGQFIITGFPYTCVNANAQVANMAPMIRYVTVPSGAFQLTNYMGANEAQTYFYWSHANNWQVMTGDEINNDTSFAMYAGFVYEATV